MSVSDSDAVSLPALLAARLDALASAPYCDADTAGVAGLAAESVRYLGNAVPRGGVTDPATVAAVAADLSLLASRLPALVSVLGGWLMYESAAGRLDDEHSRPPAELAPQIVTASSDACQSARDLARALNTLIDLTEPLHAAGAVSGSGADRAGAAA
jgi:hypothetical protein